MPLISMASRLTPSATLTLGFIGLGAMGGAFARNLARAGYRVLGFDLSADRLAACTAVDVGDAGGAGTVSAAESAEALVDTSDVVLTSLPSSQAFVDTADTIFIPRAHRGQIF